MYLKSFSAAIAAFWLAGLSATVMAGVEMSSSAIFFYNCEFQPHYGQPISQCSLLLRRAKAEGGRKINIVPTQYWIDDPNEGQVHPSARKCNPDSWATPQKVHHYCAKWEWDSQCKPFDKETIDKWTSQFTECMEEAADLFDEVLISPHLDDGTNRGRWRNLLVYDPLAKDAYGFTYWDIMVKPILTAANKAFANKPGKVFHFGLQGEMGGTVFHHPDSYVKLADIVRKSWKAKGQLKTGILLNHGYLPGVINRKAETDEAKCAIPKSKFWCHDGAFGEVLPFEQWPNYKHLAWKKPALVQLFDTIDFLGISNYARTPAVITPASLESGPVKYEAELKAMGLNFKDIVSDKAFYWNEFAIGGGISECGDTPADTGAQAGLFPWLGGTSTYTQRIDPWKMYNGVDARVPAREYMRDYYRNATVLLAQGGINYPVDACYLWNVVSWDVQGIHPASSSGEGTFADPVAMKIIRDHNYAMNKGKGKGATSVEDGGRIRRHMV